MARVSSPNSGRVAGESMEALAPSKGTSRPARCASTSFEGTSTPPAHTAGHRGPLGRTEVRCIEARGKRKYLPFELKVLACTLLRLIGSQRFVGSGCWRRCMPVRPEVIHAG